MQTNQARVTCIQGFARTSTTSPSPVESESSPGLVQSSPHHPVPEVGPRLRMGKETEQNNPSVVSLPRRGIWGNGDGSMVATWEWV